MVKLLSPKSVSFKTALKNSAVPALCALLAFFLFCTTRSMRRIDLLSEAASKGEYLEGIKSIRNSPKLYGNLNQFLYWFDQGVLFHYAGEYDSSLLHLERAEKVLDDLYARSVLNEAASLLTNDNLRPYRSRRYEQIILHQLLSFDYLAKEELDESLVETRKVQLVFDRFKSKDGKKDKYNDDGMSHYLSSIVYDAQRERDNAAISLYKSVLAYRNGPVPLPDEVKNLAYYRFQQDGREDDIAELNLTPAFSREYLPGVNASQAEVIIIGHAGMGPVLEETLFWGTYVVGGVVSVYYRNPYGDTVLVVLPAPPLPEKEVEKLEAGEKTKVGTTFHIKFALPSVKTRESKTIRFSAWLKDGSFNIPGIVLTDTDRLLEQDLSDNFNVTLLRTVVRVVLRTIAAQRTKSNMTTESPLLNLILNVGTDVLADQLEKADTRLSFLLPKKVHIMRIPVEPGSHTVLADAIDKNGHVVNSMVWEEIKVGDGEKRFLFFPSLE